MTTLIERPAQLMSMQLVAQIIKFLNTVAYLTHIYWSSLPTQQARRFEYSFLINSSTQLFVSMHRSGSDIVIAMYIGPNDGTSNYVLTNSAFLPLLLQLQAENITWWENTFGQFCYRCRF